MGYQGYYTEDVGGEQVNIPQKKEILTGFHKPWRDDPVFQEVMALCNDSADKKKFVPVREQKREERDGS